MPELPEVETIRIGLSSLLPGKKIIAVRHDWPKSFPNAVADVDQFLYGAQVIDVRRRAKVLMIDLDSGYSLLVHLKMTGQLVYIGNRKSEIGNGETTELPNSEFLIPNSNEASLRNKAISLNSQSPSPISSEASLRFGAGHPNQSLIGELPDKSTRVELTFTDGSTLYFNDQRKFGWMRLFPTIQIPEIDFFKRVGPEPLESDFTATHFIERLMRRKNSAIKAVLLDQTVIAGVGNIYADESLFAAKIHPDTKVIEISKSKLGTLLKELRAVLFLSIEKGGSTDRNYVNAEGKKGSYIDFAQVFRRQNQPCPRCGNTIIKIRSAGRGTHLCPRCQKVPREVMPHD